MFYSSDGRLLQKKYSRGATEVSKIDYLNGIDIRGNAIDAINVDDVRILKQSTSWLYEYKLKDHLGNVRTTFIDENNNGLISTSEIKQLKLKVSKDPVRYHASVI